MAGVDAEYSVYVGNLCLSTALADMEDLLYELFLQAGPLEKVFIPYDKESGRHKGFGFVEFEHVESVQYSIDLLHGICLCGRPLNVNKVIPRSSTSQTVSPSVATTSVAPLTPNVSVTSSQPSANSSIDHYLTFDTAHLASGCSSERTHITPCLAPLMTEPHSSTSSIPSLFQQTQTNTIPSLFPSLSSESNSTPSLFPWQRGPSSYYNEPTRHVVPAHREYHNHPSNNHLPLNSTHFHPSHAYSQCNTSFNTSHHRLHQSRLSADDYPGWVKPQVKERMFQYHLDMLESTLHTMKTVMSKGNQPIGSNRHFS